MLDIVASYDPALMIQTQENGKKPHFGPDLGPPKFFYKTSS